MTHRPHEVVLDRLRHALDDVAANAEDHSGETNRSPDATPPPLSPKPVALVSGPDRAQRWPRLLVGTASVLVALGAVALVRSGERDRVATSTSPRRVPGGDSLAAYDRDLADAELVADEGTTTTIGDAAVVVGRPDRPPGRWSRRRAHPGLTCALTLRWRGNAMSDQ